MKSFLTFSFIVVLIGLLIVCIAILKTLQRTSLFTIQKRVKTRDATAEQLLPLFLKRNQTAWLLQCIVVFSQLILVTLLAWIFWSPVAIFIVGTGLLVGNYVLRFVVSREQIERLAAKGAPYIAIVLEVLHPITTVLKHWLVRGPEDVSLSFQSKDELVQVLEDSQSAHDFLNSDERRIAAHVLTFGDKQIVDIMIPRRVVKSVDLEASVDIKLLSDLHDSGFSRFPVYQGGQESIVGTLYIKDLVGAAKGSLKRVKDVYEKRVFFVNETQNLDHVLNAFLRTKHHLFIAVNEFQEMTGVVTIEDVLEQLLGTKIIDEFDKYDDLREVAALAAKKQAKQRGNTIIPPEPEIMA